jgi:hypothetical protein
MSEKAVFRCTDPVQANKLLRDRVWPHLKPWLIAGHRMVIEVRPEKRTLDQNAKFHALCADIAKSGLMWAGKVRKAEEWKVLLVSGHAIATKEGSEIIPGLENEFVNVRESTASMSKKRGASLIEYTLAFGVQNGVRFSAPEYIDQETGEIK